MVVRATRTSCPWSYQIAESTPCYADIVRTIHAVEVAVYAILKVAMVYPDIFGTGNRKIVVAIYIVGSCALEDDVSQNDVLA